MSAKNKAAVALGRLGGLKGGKARMKSMTAKERGRDSELAVAPAAFSTSGHTNGLDKASGVR